ncbi:MAG: Holliday junction branch migration protein RuvA [Sphingobacteriales bacterium]|jgi:Holliday junction DNA helicase RuvA|nr:Holliday junction branch migration protein RuvA [Sphingobacteriales bacterium]MBP9142486.1 Holliday junction branch migration protein RuvA [Chitinophagales bacterium]MDA0198653.1 Holliday junction branch migration protein RuvA [Bacteroidota bacterium]MBK6890702.1 Holliday junction branch migration protein RuvA [Sphingobacteriales bacterium]MBK7526245.1 Holliday junction branch migration protein RuvA [Sphingobacteriales bacterium]
MYAYIKGALVFKSPAQIIIETSGGVAYWLHISLNTFTAIQNLNEAKLFTWLAVREDAHILYGFFDEAERDLFLQLVSVNGVGPSTAQVMLSFMRPQELLTAITTGDHTSLKRIKGIGAKTAERIVLELKDKLGKAFADTNLATLTPISGGSNANATNNFQAEALAALINLGIAKPVAVQAIQKVLKANPAIANVETLIRQALNNL